MSCFMCKGTLEDKYTTFMADLGKQYMIVKDVPSQVCRQCGEVSYNHETAQQLAKLVDDMKSAKSELVITSFMTEVA